MKALKTLTRIIGEFSRTSLLLEGIRDAMASQSELLNRNLEDVAAGLHGGTRSLGSIDRISLGSAALRLLAAKDLVIGRLLCF
jgi:hypothetical protein